MASIDFDLPLREQIYELPNTILVTKEEKGILYDFVLSQYTVFFRKQGLDTKGYYKATKKDIENIIGGNKRNLTFEIAINKLLNESKRLQSSQLEKRIEKLKERILETQLSNDRIMTSTQYDKLSDKEYQIGIVMTYIESSLTLDIMPVGDVSKKIGISQDTIRQACRSGRILARRTYKTWLVSLSECKEYWKNNEEGADNDEE